MADLRVVVDCRALQDPDYATKGIGQHTLHILSCLRGVGIVGITERMLPAPRADAADFIDSFTETFPAADVYVNPSPLTHDTAYFVMARRHGMRTAAVVHDFIPFRQPALRADREAFAAYQYLVATLSGEIARFLPHYDGDIITLHCRSRFDAAAHETLPDVQVAGLAEGENYIFAAAADDPRKNVGVAIQAASRWRAMGLRLVIGGGLSAPTRRRLSAEYPSEICLAEPIFLPRLSDGELRGVYLGASLVVVCSLDEGFSLPVSEAIALRRPVVASDIPAHAEQVADRSLLFAPADPDDLRRAAAYAHRLAAGPVALGAAYRTFDHAAEAAALRAVLAPDSAMKAPTAQPRNELTIVGPDFDKASGIAVYNRSMVQECRRQNRAVTYVDVDGFEPEYFHQWLLAHQDTNILYVMGNNNLHHTRCFIALRNVPGPCILHDSRLFEFLLNREGPHRLAELWNLRHPAAAAIDVDTITDWQLERRHLAYSFLDPLIGRCPAILVHSRLLAAHISDTYGYTSVAYLPFAVQMTQDEIDRVAHLRRGRRRAPGDTVHLVMLGETDPIKACCEIVFAVKLLRLAGIDAMLTFVGKSDEPYRSELVGNARLLGIEEQIRFVSYVSRSAYLDYMAASDVLVQLRYPLFGQVSGPVGDAVVCGVPMVTTRELAAGSGLEDHCTIVPDRFSPLHIADAVRSLIAADAPPLPPARVNTMADYVGALFATLAQLVS
jgi:glycosyltransferase involved in cell wall biosynthesis